MVPQRCRLNYCNKMIILYRFLSKISNDVILSLLIWGVTVVDSLKGLKKLAENAKNLDGSHEVSLGTLFNGGFIQSNTEFNSIDELFEKAGFNVETKEDFEAIPQEEIDSFVRANTNFESFNEMYKAAATEYVKQQLFKGLK